MNMKLEVVIIPVSDVDRAKAFYQKLGWRVDGDFDAGENCASSKSLLPAQMPRLYWGKESHPAELDQPLPSFWPWMTLTPLGPSWLSAAPT